MTDVLSTNIFALLDEPSAPAPAPVTEKKTPAAAKGPTPKGAAAAAKSVPGSKGAAVNKASNARQADDVETGSDERRDARKPVRGGRGGARGSFRGRGREFDRHSGATRVDSDKKEVAGKGAWGEPTANYGDAEAPALAADGSPLDPASATTPADADEEKENTKTLEEYLAEKSAGKAAASVVASRKPNEGADDSQWKDSKVFARKEEEDVFFKTKDQGQKIKPAPKTQRATAKQHIDIERRYAAPPREESRGDRGDRGGRGRGAPRGAPRGGRGRGGDRNGAPRPAGAKPGQAVVIDDQNFPSLKA